MTLTGSGAIVVTSLLAASALAVPSAPPDPSGEDPSPAPSAAASVDPTVTEEAGMRITSTAFEPEGDIPVEYTCEGLDISPPLTIEDLPPGTVSLALVMDDPDAPAGTWDHWVEYDIEPVTEIPEDVEGLGTPGTNSWERSGYRGPCPPSGVHRYFFTVYALDTELGLEPGADKATVLAATHGHVLEEASLLGFYSRD
jgi:Raf kinase inhibitor-like YbhB/YbcL family protein